VPLTAMTLLRVFIPFALGYFLSYVFRTVNAVIATDLVADIGLPPASLGLLTAAYFLAFAAFQLPLGLLLDRYGARRVESVLLLFAAAGALVFARADSLSTLIIGRGLIGLGVSACLMAAFKSFSSWFPADRLPLANAVQMVSGGAGALMATVPVQAALAVTDWRGIFQLLAGLTLLAALTIFFVVPESADGVARESLRQQLQGLRTVYTSRHFWRVAPWAILSQSAYLSIQGLWSGPWLRDVAGYDRSEVANVLLLVAAAMIVGYLGFGTLTDRLARRGIPPMRVMVCGLASFMLVQSQLCFQWLPLTQPLWVLFGLCGTASILPYAIIAQGFPRQLAGRANTGLNLPVFIAAFAAQWLIGTIIGLWPEAAGHYHPAGFRAGFGLLLLLQAVAACWFWLGGRLERK